MASRSTMPRRLSRGTVMEVGAHRGLVDGVERLNALTGGGEGEVAAEEELVDHLELVGADEGVVGDPGAAEEGGDVGENVLVFAEEDEHFIDPGIAEVGNEDLEIREGAGDIVEQVRPRVFHFGFPGRDACREL